MYKEKKIPRLLKPLSWGYLHHCMSVNYLGVIPDSQPTWKEHVDVTVRKAHNLLWVCRGACGVTWVLNPNLVLSLHVSLIWSFATFESLV